ncbi:ornithine decarboxylase [Lacticaseibacillus mingshuiensis]|uniref:Orn/Lys/Arg family decarboxylase n=1 Tax=Lacticaseibacillus mingshuiensis TaxID=2799574 RepID=UPI0019418215|nr:ornithine decarboxylase [Lacticaseibacillus mingshuiensis]
MTHSLKIGLGDGATVPAETQGWTFVKASNVPATALAAVVGPASPQDAGAAQRAGLPTFSASPAWAEVFAAATAYENQQVPAFLRDLIAFSAQQPASFSTPGHHGGRAFESAPAGQALRNFFGQALFTADVSDSVDQLGDMMTHGGSPLEAERFAAETYGVDEAYFVTNGTTSANAIAAAAALAPGDLVLFDRNNHKSLANAALVFTGAKPVYLPTNRNALGAIGGPLASSLDEKALREAAAKVDPVRGAAQRPFRLAVLQLATYDGQFATLQYVLTHLGPLCDYILFDDAWGGYEHFVPALAASDVAKLELGPDDPGIFVTQSLHKTMTALAQGSQILKRDHHLQGQARYIDHDRFNHAYLKYVTTSYSYPLYASLTVNAAVQAFDGQAQWAQTQDQANDFRRALFATQLFRPFVAPTVGEKPWAEADDAALRQASAWTVAPGATWHGFGDVASGQYLNNPLKVTVSYGTEAYPLPAPIVGAYLEAQGIIAEKNDLFSGLYLATPGSSEADWQRLLAALKNLERLYFAGADATAALPDPAFERYAGMTLRELAYQMTIDIEDLELTESLQGLFQAANWGEADLTPAAADAEFVRGNGEWIPLRQAVGRVALEGALPYPPGVFVVMPGEKWSALAQQHFLNLAELMRLYPGFVFEIQGVYGDAKDLRVYVAK